MTKHLVYKTTNLVNGKYYIGVHSCKCNPCRYLGSGVALKKAIRKYGRDNFKRETLREFSTREEAFEYEADIVDKLDIRSYNITNGGSGTFVFKTREHTSQTKRKISDSLKGMRTIHHINSSKPVLCLGEKYLCQIHASRHLKIPLTTLRRWLRCSNYPDYQLL